MNHHSFLPLFTVLLFSTCYLNLAAQQDDKYTIQQLLDFSLDELMQVHFIPATLEKQASSKNQINLFKEAIIAKEIMQ